MTEREGLVTEAQIDAALSAPIPGGSTAEAWLITCGINTMRAKQNGRDVIWAMLTAALTAQESAGEPVAWRWRGRILGADWNAWDAGPARPPYPVSDNYQIEPLYTHPPAQRDDELAALRQRISEFDTCIQRVAAALGAVCGGVDGDQNDPNSTTQVLLKAIAQRDGAVVVPREPTEAMIRALTQEWHPKHQGNIRERYAAMLRASQGETK